MLIYYYKCPFVFIKELIAEGFILVIAQHLAIFIENSSHRAGVVNL